MLPLELEGKMLELMFKMKDVFQVMCESALTSAEVLKELQDCDLLIYDTTSFCAALLGERHNIPLVELLPLSPNGPAASFHMIPMPLSYVPVLLTRFTDKMTFMERATNLAYYFGQKLFISMAINKPMNALKLKYNIVVERSFEEAIANVELLLILADFALEYPQPLLPGRKC